MEVSSKMIIDEPNDDAKLMESDKVSETQDAIRIQ